jgi:hypothetical protein
MRTKPLKSQVAASVIITLCWLCSCASFAPEGQSVTVTTSPEVVRGPGCKLVGNVDETADNGGPTATSSAADQVRIKMQNAVFLLGGNVLLVLSIKSGGYASSTRGTGEGYWCPGRG